LKLQESHDMIFIYSIIGWINVILRWYQITLIFNSRRIIQIISVFFTIPQKLAIYLWSTFGEIQNKISQKENLPLEIRIKRNENENLLVEIVNCKSESFHQTQGRKRGQLQNFFFFFLKNQEARKKKKLKK